MMHVFICLPLNDVQLSRLQKAVGATVLHVHPDFDQGGHRRVIFNTCEIVFGNPSSSWIAENSVLRWVQLESVGFGEYASLNWGELGRRIQITNLAGFFAEPVAESILAGILALYRGIDRIVALQQRREWQGGVLRPTLKSLLGANVVLFGFGAINRRLAELLSPFECNVHPFGRDWNEAELNPALESADIIVCTAPDTPKSRGVFNRTRIGMLRPSALFINFGRGSLVDEEALADALESNSLAGAVVDVTREEPLPSNHRFWACPNLILTQHSGGGTIDEIDRKIDVFLDNFGRYRQSTELQGKIDFSRGY